MKFTWRFYILALVANFII